MEYKAFRDQYIIIEMQICFQNKFMYTELLIKFKSTVLNMKIICIALYNM